MAIRKTVGSQDPAEVQSGPRTAGRSLRREDDVRAEAMEGG